MGGDKSARTYHVPERPQISPPVTRRASDGVPVVLLSIDTLRYDQRAALAPLLDELGEDVVVPSEPRTQGYWTAPSHACMFTGVHPGRHRYLGWDAGANRPIDPTLETVPTLLTDLGYKCSGIVSHGRIRPQFGFGRGFHRFEYDPMTDWVRRDNDARSTVDRLVEWVERDSRLDGQLFYFAHLFDPHGPYIPPASDIDHDLDLDAVDRFRSRTVGPYGGGDQLFNPKPDVPADDSELMWDYYVASVRYTALQATRFIRALKRCGLFDDALIIVTGDHGEEWGESGYYGHNSLYDKNIRPFMAIKSPEGANWKITEAVDTIDILPTIARSVGVEPPDQCQGQPLQDSDRTRGPRIVEGFGQEWYHVAVEEDDRKAIVTYQGNYPNRPSKSQLADGPMHVEWHDIGAVRDGDYSGRDVTPGERDRLERIVREFVTSDGHQLAGSSTGFVTASDREPTEQLEYLGYK